MVATLDIDSRRPVDPAGDLPADLRELAAAGAVKHETAAAVRERVQRAAFRSWLRGRKPSIRAAVTAGGVPGITGRTDTLRLVLAPIGGMRRRLAAVLTWDGLTNGWRDADAWHALPEGTEGRSEPLRDGTSLDLAVHAALAPEPLDLDEIDHLR